MQEIRMLIAWRVVIMRVKIRGPKAAIVLKINSCPMAEHMEMRQAWKANSGCWKRKVRQVKKTPRNRREPMVKIVEKRLTPNIIWTDETLYCLKISDCQLDVKLSNAMYPRRIMIPAKVVSVVWLAVADGSADRRKRATPTDMREAVMYSCHGYVLFETTFPINMTGMTLEAFAKTWVGKLTNLSASY